MAITLRTQKGSELTFTELDGNFTHLDEKIDGLDTNSITYVPDTLNNLEWVEGTYDFGNNIIKYANAIQTEAELANYSPATYHGMTMHVHATGALYFAHAGVWRKILTDNADGAAGIAGYVDSLSAVAYEGSINSLVGVNTTGATAGQVLKYNGSQWVPAADIEGSATGIALTDLSVVVGAAGTSNLAYNDVTGVFSFTPPTVPTSILDLGINDGSSGQFLTTNGAGAFTFASVSSGIASVVEDTTPQLGGDLDVNGNSIQYTFNIGASGTSDYIFTDPGNHWFPTATNDPVLYLRRGETYVFVNNTGTDHPFAIRVADGGASYTTGVTGSQSGTQTFKVSMGAPATLYYQCTLHSGMGNIINII